MLCALRDVDYHDGSGTRRILSLTIRGERGHDLLFDRLELEARGLELLSARQRAGIWRATFRVEKGGVRRLLDMIAGYVRTPKKGKKRRCQDVIDSISSITLADVRDYWTDPTAFPSSSERLQWEVWLRADENHQADAFQSFRTAAISVGLHPATQFVSFPERIVTAAFGTARQLKELGPWFLDIAELRRAVETPTDYVAALPKFQRQLAAEFAARLTAPPADAPAVAILDRGVHRLHPLLSPYLAESDLHAVQGWERVPRPREDHGTEMAGIALFGTDMADQVRQLSPRPIRHRIESVRILPPPPKVNADRELDAFLFSEAVMLLEIQARARRRAICLAVTRPTGDCGQPTSSSAMVDQLASGAKESDRPRRLFVVSTGNYDPSLDRKYRYFKTNCTRAPSEDPAQAWNALTVGAYTERTLITDGTRRGWRSVADSGQLCPTSRTSHAWPPDHQRRWPLKPDIVMEGGNYAVDGSNTAEPIDDLGLLTTTVTSNTGAFGIMRDSSAATAAASRLAARLWGHYPSLWPETVRAVLVHSARWTPGMMRQIPGEGREAALKRLRCFGYGAPDEDRALWSLRNSATQIIEDEIQPFREDDGKVRSNVMRVHELPWPREKLAALQNTPVTLRVTLSYFIEPSPGSRGWTYQHRYASFGLRFDVSRPNEDRRLLTSRLSKDARAEDDEDFTQISETRSWTVGRQKRRYGSIHSDWWRGPAAELALSNLIAIYPVTGWWRERPAQGRIDRTARYSLIVSLEADSGDIDLYTPIEAQISVSVSVPVDGSPA